MTPATSGLVNTGINARRRTNQPGSRSQGFVPGQLDQQPPAAPPPLSTQPGNAAPPGGPLPVGNGIAPVSPNMAVLNAPQIPNAPPPRPAPVAPVAAAPVGAPAPQYAPTGLNFGPGHDLQSSVIAPDATAPDRTAMAKSLLANFDASTADQQRQDYRDVGQQASALGRLGMGSTAQDIQEVGRKHLTDRATLESKLAYDTSDQAIQDAANARNELRTERGYETGQAQTAIDRQVQQAQLEEALRNGQFQRGISLGEYGGTANPAYAKLQAAQAGDTSGGDLTGIAELLKRYGYSTATAGKAA